MSHAGMMVKQQNRFDCLAAVLAMVLGWTLEQVYLELGHDGTCKRFTTLEAVALLAQHGLLLGTWINADGSATVRLKDPAILFVKGHETAHAVFWTGKVVLDPNPQRKGTHDLDDYRILQWWPVLSIVVPS